MFKYISRSFLLLIFTVVILCVIYPSVVWIIGQVFFPFQKAADLAVLFFEHFSQEHPGMFPSAVTQTGADGKPQTSIQPVKEGSDIQSTFFDMWRQEHPDATAFLS
jgi:K+-transporting ATPase ATPase C chain